ncbi:MAG: hypothetical protein CSA34_00520 [Desulfobulbus propionicus]|nr:MAG: hypothetical protein CSA34_00520 [Desulfobulbus propionicus]
MGNSRIEKAVGKRVHIPVGEPSGRIICTECGNTSGFVEVATNVVVTTHYVQNWDGSFTAENSDSEIHGQARLLCGKCGADLTPFHGHVVEMSF